MASKFTPSFILLLLILSCLSFNHAKASDTLTLRQVYSFNVGDTFDYEQQTGGGSNYVIYLRKVCMQKTYSTDLDTLFIGFGPPGGSITEIDTVPHLDSFAFRWRSGIDTLLNWRLSSIDSSTYPGYVSNTINWLGTGAGITYVYTQRLGTTQFSYWSEDGNDNIDSYTEQLIYYSNGSVSFGTPYYIANGSNLIKYIPLPESCAVWTWAIYGTPYPPDSIYGTVTQQARTGNTIRHNGINYVELICRSENGFTGQYTPDSLVGYFYNDTLAQTAYFVQDYNNPVPSVLCAFNMLGGTQCSSTSSIVIDTILIGGSYRTYWYCPFDPNQGPPDDCPTNIIAGIGSLSGLVPLPVPYLWYYQNYASFSGYYRACSSLTCFSVCGQTLYPNDSAASCPLLTGIREVAYNNFSLQISPNPFATDISITIHTENPSPTISTVSDILGRTVYTTSDFAVSGVFTKTLDLSSLPEGIYLLQVMVNGERIERKIVKD